ncbi:gluconate kinase [Bifidobacterium rousetti]|nr:gluconate kinase [Bifidobacterium rousetti]
MRDETRKACVDAPRYAATFDSGTTALKGALVAQDGRIVASTSEDLDLVIAGPHGEYREQDPDQWWHAFVAVSRRMLAEAVANEPGLHVGGSGDSNDSAVAGRIAGIIFSGQMQDVIVLDRDLNPVRNAILYSDGRAEEEAAELAERYGSRRFLDVVGNRLEGCLPLPKLMWMRAHEPDASARTAHVLISSKDYLIARLTGRCVGDVAACSTAGAMGIRSGEWDARLLKAADIDHGILPELHRPQDIVGEVTPQAAILTGFAPGTPVFAGIGDAGATTFASGVDRPGRYNINLGTSGWIATVSSEPFVDKPGAANLAFGVAPGFVNAVPFLNAGDVHKWVTRALAGVADASTDAGADSGTGETPDYAKAHDLIERSQPGANGVLCLPYLVGERFPVMNPSIRGAYVGISPDTTRADLVRAALEGVAFSIRQGMESFDTAPEEISLIGGGAREPAWCQIMADVLGSAITVFANADILPAVALASLVFQNPQILTDAAQGTTYTPDPAAASVYDTLYPKFLKLYPALSSLM